jgi:hypothetical protein
MPFEPPFQPIYSEQEEHKVERRHRVIAIMSPQIEISWDVGARKIGRQKFEVHDAMSFPLSVFHL